MLSNGQAPSGYLVKRYDAATGNAQTVLAGCAGTVAATTCTENDLPAGQWKYTITPIVGANWQGPGSGLSAAVSVASQTLTLAKSVFGAPLPQTVTGTFTGFAVGEAVSYRLDSATALTATPAAADANGSGTITALTIPAGTSNGAHTVYVIGGAAPNPSQASMAILVDTIPPTVSSIVRADPASTNTGPLHWTVTFSEPVTNVAAANFSLTTSGLGGTSPTIVSVAASGQAPAATWTVTANTAGTTGTNSGAIGLNLTSAGTIQDIAANGLSAATPVVGQAYVFDTTAPAAPTSVTLTNGGGTGNAYINNATKGGSSIDVAIGSASTATDTVTLTVSDAGSAHTLTRTAAATTGVGTLHFAGLDLSSFNDGTVTFSATAADQLANTSTAVSRTVIKDVVIPNAPTAVTLTNGGGTSNAYINNTNKATVNYTTTLPASSLTTDTITLTITDPGTAHTITPTSQPGTNGAGTLTFNTNNLTTINDGTITATATTTDQAGNTSTPTTTTTTKDVIAPSNNVVLTAAGSASLAGSTLFYKGNDSLSGNRTFKLLNTVTDDGSGPASSHYTALSGSTTGWTFTGASTVTSPAGGPYLSSTAFTWSNSTASSPSETITAADAAGNTTSQTLTFSDDTGGPTNNLTTTNQTGGGSHIAGTTLYYRGGLAGTFSLTNTVIDTQSGPASASFPAVAANGWTHTFATITAPAGGPYQSNIYSFTNTASQPPSNTRTFTATDAVGNTSASVLAFTADSTAPVTSESFAPLANASGWNNSDTTVNLSSTDGGSGVGSITYSETGAQTAPNITVPGSSAAPVITSEGTTTINYTATDNVGNVEATKSITVKLDNQSPTQPAFLINGQTLTVPAATDTGPSGLADAGYYYCIGAGCTPNTLFGTGSTGPNYSFTWSSQPPDGTYTLAAKTDDAAGNSSILSTSQTITIDNTAPTIANVTLTSIGAANQVAETGEHLTITYSEAIKTSTFCSTWTTQTPPALTDATVTITNNLASDPLTVTTPTCSFHLGTVVPGDYVSGTTTFTSSTIAWDPTAETLTITLGTLTTNNRSSHTAKQPTYTPPASPNQLTDPAGNALASTPFTATTTTGW